MWMQLCKFAGTPRKLPGNVKICSCHFVGKQGPSKDHPNPIPYEPPASLRNPHKMKAFRKNVPSPQDGDNALLQTSSNNLGANVAEEECIDSPEPARNRSFHTASPQAVQEFSTPERALVIDRDCPDSIVNSQTPVKTDVDSFQETLKRGGDLDSFEAAFAKLPEDSVRMDQGDHSVDLPDDLFQLGSTVNRLKDMWEPSGSNAPEAEVQVNAEASTTSDIGVQADSPPFSYEKSQSWNEKDFEYFTGVKRESFEILYTLFEDDCINKLKYRRKRNTPLRTSTSLSSTRNNLFLTLVRLRRGFSLTDMRMLFGLAESRVSDIFSTWLRLLSIKFKSLEDAIFLSAKAQEENKPDCYESFPNLRCILDTTDFKIQKPTNMEQQSITFSTYKQANVVKFLVATSLYGGLSFISEGVEGSISDRQMFLQSGIMDHLCSGDAVMCDRGFDIEADLNEIEVDILIPPFQGKDRDSFTAREILLGKAVASSRIHVETFIGRIKFFKFLRQVIPNTMLDVLSDAVRVCANLVNLNDPFIRWDSVKQKGKRNATKLNVKSM